MKQSIVLMVACLACMVTISCGNFKSRQSEELNALTALNDSLSEELDRSSMELDGLLQSVDQIQKAFQSINEAEDIVTLETAKGETANTKSILDNVAKIENKMRYNREMIEHLQSQLNKSQGKNTKLRRTLESMLQEFKRKFESKNNTLDSLRYVVKQQSMQIRSQKDTIVRLSNNVDALTVKSIEQKETMRNQEDKLNKVYYVFGTKKELRAQNIMNRNTVLTTSAFNRDYFAQADAREKKVIPLYSKRVKVMTTHPKGSYELVRDANRCYVLKIEDPKLFWSISKYLVIVVR